jgi:hypothetical protein
VILCQNHEISLLKTTANSIRSRYPGYSFICCADESANEEDLKKMNEICPTYIAGNTFSSLINQGMKKTPALWNFILCAGVTMRSKLDYKFFKFIKNDKDILFPISNNIPYFVDGTLNGIFVNKNTFKEIGNWINHENLEWVKTLWATEAIRKGCTFKAIANSKIC